MFFIIHWKLIPNQPKFLTKEQRVVVAESDEEFLMRHHTHLQNKKDGKALSTSSEADELENVLKAGRSTSQASVSSRVSPLPAASKTVHNVSKFAVSSLPSVSQAASASALALISMDSSFRSETPDLTPSSSGSSESDQFHTIFSNFLFSHYFPDECLIRYYQKRRL